MSGATIAQIIGIALALVLAVRALGNRRMDARRTGLMAAAWIAIIIVVTFAVTTLSHAG